MKLEQGAGCWDLSGLWRRVGIGRQRGQRGLQAQQAIGLGGAYLVKGGQKTAFYQQGEHAVGVARQDLVDEQTGVRQFSRIAPGQQVLRQQAGSSAHDGLVWSCSEQSQQVSNQRQRAGHAQTLVSGGRRRARCLDQDGHLPGQHACGHGHFSLSEVGGLGDLVEEGRGHLSTAVGVQDKRLFELPARLGNLRPMLSLYKAGQLLSQRGGPSIAFVAGL
jgi:hypothetical protein